MQNEEVLINGGKDTFFDKFLPQPNSERLIDSEDGDGGAANAGAAD
jgi:hypothetical protein